MTTDDLVALLQEITHLGYDEGPDIGVYQNDDPQGLCQTLGFKIYVRMTRHDMLAAMTRLVEDGTAYRKWTVRLCRGDAPFVAMFSEDEDAVHFRMLTL